MVRRGHSLRSVAKKFGVSLSTVQLWLARAGQERLDRVDWSDRPSGCRTSPQRTTPGTEDLILELRKQLREQSDLGEFGAAAIHRELQTRRYRKRLPTLPSIRTIGRILERRGALDGRRRVRRPAPPKGWYLPDVAKMQEELDSFDFVEGLVIRGNTHVEILNAISLHGGLCGSWVRPSWTAKFTVETLIQHWQTHGLPAYAQFDNDTRFQGAHQWPDTFGRVTRTCLQLGVTPVFAPPRETGFQASIESYNGRWQAKVWTRFEHTSLHDLRMRSNRYIRAARQQSALRRERAPHRKAFPKQWHLDLQKPLQGRVVFLRRTNDRGEVELLGHRYLVDKLWIHRLVRAEVNLTQGSIRFYRLRRRQPEQQTLATTIKYNIPKKPFKG